MDGNDRLPLTLPEAMRRLRITRPTAARLIAAGELPASKVGGRWRVPAAAVDRLLAPQPEAAE